MLILVVYFCMSEMYLIIGVCFVGIFSGNFHIRIILLYG